MRPREYTPGSFCLAKPRVGPIAIGTAHDLRGSRGTPLAHKPARRRYASRLGKYWVQYFPRAEIFGTYHL